MLTVKSVNVRDNLEWSDRNSMGETVVISRPRNQNIILAVEKTDRSVSKGKILSGPLCLLIQIGRAHV